ncbi:HAD family hydrolase [Brevibacillus sp. B_LB10_24]|uniref:HAD family hydrolase n=1 Tax=Brevibacillus sp. B_LB10_24 TaxID=3380645 RepID=UPI0038BAC160
MMTVKAVLFDFDGTLADTLPVIYLAFQGVFREFEQREVTPEEIVKMFGPPEAGVLERQIKRVADVQPAIERFYQLYAENHRELVRASAEINRMLQYLKERGLRMGVVTGKGRRSADISLRLLEMDSYFDIVVTGDDVVRPKPHPEGIHSVLERLEVPAAEALFVGDSNADIRAGKAAGMRTIGVKWFEETQTDCFSPEPDYLFETVADFQQFLAKALTD